jgi:hypothetical protein
MIKSIWEKIKLAFERKPVGEVLIPTPKTVELVEEIKPKRVVKRKPKNEST